MEKTLMLMILTTLAGITLGYVLAKQKYCSILWDLRDDVWDAIYREDADSLLIMEMIDETARDTGTVA